MICTILLTTSCSILNTDRGESSQIYTQPWAYHDLRAYDPADTSTAQQDLIAAYYRDADHDAQIRLDFLDLSDIPDYDLYLAIDSAPGGSTWLPIQAETTIEWDKLITISAKGEIRAFSYNHENQQIAEASDMSLRIVRNPVYDYITIAFNKNSLIEKNNQGNFSTKYSPSIPFHFQVFITSVDSPQVFDVLNPVSSKSAPPLPAQVLFAFWNAFPAYTPASALRRWDGAHTGPHGGRHGLYNLIRTSRNSNIPLLLLDLNNPFSLSALNYMGKSDIINEMATNQLLILPKAIPASNSLPFQLTPLAIDTIHKENQRTSKIFDLPANPFIFSPTGLETITQWGISEGKIPANVVFYPCKATTQENANNQDQFIDISTIYQWGEYRAIPVPGYGSQGNTYEQATRTGLSINTKKAILKFALNANQNGTTESRFILLGGELPNSTWGIPSIARVTFKYIAAHPWIKPISALDLLTMQPHHPPSDLLNTQRSLINQEAFAQIMDQLTNAPSNQLTLLAWQYLMALYAPVYPSWDELPQLRSSYIGQIETLIAASYWLENPVPIENCDIDLDHDEDTECILANENLYSTYEPQNGSLTYLFFRETDDTAHQIIAPTSELITGLSEPSTWIMDQGLLSDPSVIAGAFIDSQKPERVNIEENALTFFWESGRIAAKTYHLLPNGLQVDYQMREKEASVEIQIPLIVDPWRRFSPEWAESYFVTRGDETLRWGLTSEVMVEIRMPFKQSIDTFLESQSFMHSPEDPNRDYPAGHYMPFPVATINSTIIGNSTIQILIIK